MSEGTYPIICIIVWMSLLPAGVLAAYVCDRLEARDSQRSVS